MYEMTTTWCIDTRCFCQCISVRMSACLFPPDNNNTKPIVQVLHMSLATKTVTVTAWLMLSTDFSPALQSSIIDGCVCVCVCVRYLYVIFIKTIFRRSAYLDGSAYFYRVWVFWQRNNSEVIARFSLISVWIIKRRARARACVCVCVVKLNVFMILYWDQDVITKLN